MPVHRRPVAVNAVMKLIGAGDDHAARADRIDTVFDHELHIAAEIEINLVFVVRMRVKTFLNFRRIGFDILNSKRKRCNPRKLCFSRSFSQHAHHPFHIGDFIIFFGENQIEIGNTMRYDISVTSLSIQYCKGEYHVQLHHAARSRAAARRRFFHQQALSA